ncbi:transporter substrate-binding domain-containing protein [Shewanella indica]|uniref:Transporter substrate-binding domain-containing protein n=1 Tax=Shewanella indica TaxID=768528 RepID=A0ABU4QH87_9GAMM|nr:transporter substrate-binding domain-containing protein [Shewanella indica]MDX6017659.1 transporter substrate-binding domain-containing protein [Shewanella indica]
MAKTAITFFGRSALHVLLLLLLYSGSSSVRADTLQLSSLNWPPYTGQMLQQQGACVAVVKAALAAMGHELKINFYPWSRAVKLAGMPGSPYLGYFPEYYHQSDKFIFSKPLGFSQLALVEQSQRPVSWQQLQDLQRYNLGVVKDYVNTESLDRAMDSGRQPFELANSDEQNLRKLAAARIDAVVIDANVYRYLLRQKGMEELEGKLKLNRQLLASKGLLVAFRNSAEGQRWRDIFDQGLARIDAKSILEQHLKYH